MTREEAYDKLIRTMISDHDLTRRECINSWEFELVKEIYDHFENRSCESCKYSLKSNSRKCLVCSRIFDNEMDIKCAILCELILED